MGAFDEIHVSLSLTTLVSLLEQGGRREADGEGALEGAERRFAETLLDRYFHSTVRILVD